MHTLQLRLRRVSVGILFIQPHYISRYHETSLIPHARLIKAKEAMVSPKPAIHDWKSSLATLLSNQETTMTIVSKLEQFASLHL